MNKTARDNAPAQDASTRPRHTTSQERKGTETLPMPDNSADVAGRTRQGRAITEPGDPGVIAPEDDVLDTSRLNRQKR